MNARQTVLQMSTSFIWKIPRAVAQITDEFSWTKHLPSGPPRAGKWRPAATLPRISSGVHCSCCSADSPSTGLPSGVCCPYQPPQPGNQDWRYWSIPLPPLVSGSPGESPGESNWGSRRLCINQKWANVSPQRQNHAVMCHWVFSAPPLPEKHSTSGLKHHACWVWAHLPTEDFLPPPVLLVCEIAHEPVHAKSSIPQSSVPPQSDASPPVWVKTKTNQTGLRAPEKLDTFTNPSKYWEGTNLPPHIPTGSQETMTITTVPSPCHLHAASLLSACWSICRCKTRHHGPGVTRSPRYNASSPLWSHSG